MLFVPLHVSDYKSSWKSRILWQNPAQPQTPNSTLLVDEKTAHCSNMAIKGVYIDTSYKLHYPEGNRFKKMCLPNNILYGAVLCQQEPLSWMTFRMICVVYVHDYWGTFPPQHPLIIDLFGILFFFLWLVSFFGNGCVIYIFLLSKSLRTPVSLNFFGIS